MNERRDEGPVPHAAPSDFVRVPGLFRRWELEHVLETGIDFHLEEAGFASDGTPLLALYRRESLHRNPFQEK